MNPLLTPPVVRKLWELLLLRAMRRATDEDYVEWAWSLQEEGLDSAHLRILAGLDWPFDPGAPEYYFEETLADLGIELSDGGRPDSLIGAELGPYLRSFDPNRYLVQTPQGLKVTLPPGNILLRQYVCEIARAIVSGALPPMEGCRKIASCYHSDEMPELSSWYFDLVEGYPPTESAGQAGHAYTGIDGIIVEEAMALLASPFCCAEMEQPSDRSWP